MNHELKTWPIFWPALNSGRKNFEIRKNDRNFQAGDALCLREFDPKLKIYTGHRLFFEVTYVTNFNQRKGWVVMGLQQRGICI